MAINIEWQMLPTQNNDTAEKPLLYPRMTKIETVDFHSFCKKIAKRSIHTKGTVEAVICDMIDTFAEMLHEGKTINLEELGTFKLSVGTNANITNDIPLHKRNVLVRGINFQPSKTLMNTIGTPTFRNISSVATVPQDLLQRMLLEYFKTHDSITRSQFENLCKLKRTTAYIRLKKFIDSGFLIKIGNNRDTEYKCTQQELAK